MMLKDFQTWVEVAGQAQRDAKRHDLKAGPLAIMATGVGKSKMDGMRVVFDEFTQIELDLKDKRYEESNAAKNLTISLAVILTLILSLTKETLLLWVMLRISSRTSR